MRKIRAAVLALLALTGLALPPAAPAPAATTITVNLADSTGPVFHGASGALYGLIDRAFTVSTPAGTNETVYARNTYSWDQFDTVEATVQLHAGANTITFGNPSYYAPNIDKITVAPAVLP